MQRNDYKEQHENAFCRFGVRLSEFTTILKVLHISHLIAVKVQMIIHNKVLFRVKFKIISP